MTQEHTIQVIPAYQGMRDYVRHAGLREAGSHPEADLQELWLKYVIDPYWDQWAAGQFNETRLRNRLQNPIHELEALSNMVDILHSSSLEGIIQRSYQEMSAILPPPEPNKVICVYANPYLGATVGGVCGEASGDNILLEINPNFPNWEAMVPWVLAHEYHHSIWGYNYFYLKGNREANLLTGLIIDGQADAFAQSLNPGLNPPWIRALTPEQELEQWTIMKDFLNSTDQDIYRRFFFGDDRTGTPRHTAYTIGYHLVCAYRKANPGVGFVDLLDHDAPLILARSGYQGQPI